MQYVGQITIFPYNFEPNGWVYCDGRVLPIAQYTALFSLIGTKFGGDGTSTFALPNYMGQAPEGSNYYICLQGTYLGGGQTA